MSSASSALTKVGSPGCSAWMAARSSATAGSRTRYCDRALSTTTICGSRVSGCTRTSLTSASGSSASTSTAPVARSTRSSRAVCAPAELVISSDWPSALNPTTSVVSASSAGTDSSSRQSASALSRTMSWNPPSGSGASPPRTTICASATQPMKPGFSTSLVSSPVTRSSRYTSCSCGLSRFSPTRISLGSLRSMAISRTCTSSNGVRSRRSMVWMSTSCSRQFSSPPVSCTYSRWRPSWAQSNCRMPRSVSSVMTRAAARSAPSAALTGASHTLSTPS